MKQKDIILLFQFMKASSEDKKLLESASASELMNFVESDDVYYITKIVEACIDQEYERVPYFVHEYRKKRQYNGFHEALEKIIGEKQLSKVYETRIDPRIYRAAGVAELFLSARKPAKVAAILSHLYESALKQIEEMTTTGDIAGYDAPVGYSSRDVEKIRKDVKQDKKDEEEKVLMEEENDQNSYEIPEEKRVKEAEKITEELEKDIARVSEELCEMIEEIIDKITLDENYRNYIRELINTIEASRGSVSKLVALTDVLARLREMLPSVEAVFLYAEDKKEEENNKTEE
ncbi:hypothetical protein Rm378p116 [Rhodothermus phage RM378]|uniref:hypothetical protein n=1 Tax=Rhodothermus phage RM378 TaxID=148943 RepID=UPI000018F674|nr:hypothetical protein Rm378p116 [Rhodothermus phage RM378]